MDIFAILFCVFFFGYSLIYFYSWWFKPGDSLNKDRQKRKEYRQDLFFMPQTMLFGFYDQHPTFEMWANRAVSLLFLFVSGVPLGVAFVKLFFKK